jgi:hypothetical protein
MSKTVGISARQTWNIVTGHIKSQSKDAYCRALIFDKRIEYIQTYLLARVCYVAQVFPPPSDNTRQINKAIVLFLWTGNIFRVPLSTLYRNKWHGVWGLTHIDAKCKTLFINRMQILGTKYGTPMAHWLSAWNLTGHCDNPPHLTRIPARFEYLRLLQQETAYITPRHLQEPRRVYKRRIWDTHRSLARSITDKHNAGRATGAAPPMDSNLEKPMECANNDAHESEVVSYTT